MHPRKAVICSGRAWQTPNRDAVRNVKDIQLSRMVRLDAIGATWFNMASMVHIRPQLGPAYAQLGSNLAQRGPNLASTWSQLGPTWPQFP
eukprot:11855452-Karenia_brevis.AAC.1